LGDGTEDSLGRLLGVRVHHLDRVHADHPPALVDERSAGVAGVDVGVVLEEFRPFEDTHRAEITEGECWAPLDDRVGTDAFHEAVVAQVFSGAGWPEHPPPAPSPQIRSRA